MKKYYLLSIMLLVVSLVGCNEKKPEVVSTSNEVTQEEVKTTNNEENNIPAPVTEINREGKIWELLTQEGYNPALENNGFENNDESKLVGYNALEGTDYKIPYIKLSSEDVSSINDELSNISDVESVSTAVFLNDNILSLVCFTESPYGTGANKFYVYNVNIDTGKRLTNKELLETPILEKIHYTEEFARAKLDDEYTKQLILQNDLVRYLEHFGIRVSYIDIYTSLINNDEVVSKEVFDRNTANTTFDYDDSIGRINGSYRYNLERTKTLPLEGIQMFIGTHGDVMYVCQVFGLAGAT